MFGKWIVLEGLSTPSKSQVTRAILKSYPGSMKHISLKQVSDLKTNLVNILKLKEKIHHELSRNTSVICSSWISSTLAKSNLRPCSVEMNLLDLVLKTSRPDLSIALLTSDSEYEKNLALSEHIDLVFTVNQDESQISRLVLNHLLHHDF